VIAPRRMRDRAGALSPWLVPCFASILAGCWVEEIHIEPDGWEGGGDDAGGGEADAEPEADTPEPEDGATEEAAEVEAGPECGNGVVEGTEECDGDPSRACVDGTCAGTQSCVAGACVWGPCDLGPPPVNDGCAGAIDVGAGGVFGGDTCGASDDHAPVAACGGDGGRDVWFRFTLAQREVVYLDTVDGNLWDTVLQVRWGGCPASGSPVVCGNDQCPDVSGGRRSQILETLDPGSYFVVVDGADAAAAGPFGLLFQHAACADAGTLPGNGNYDGTMTGRTDSYTSDCGGTGMPDAAYAFGLCRPSTVTATTCNAMSGFDTVLSFAPGTCDNGLFCNDDDDACGLGGGRSTLTADLPQGLNFLIVDSRRGSPGAYRFTISGM